MSRVKVKDTDIEVALRSALYRRGFRYRKHVKTLPGTPDIVFPKSKVVVFVDGDFWHGYQFARLREKLSPFWQTKIQKNRDRDLKNFRQLRSMGWRVIRVWQHSVERQLDATIARIERYVASD